MDLITKDLSTFSSDNLQILARYFGIPARIEQQELTKLLSQSIYHKYYAKARFPGEYKSRGEIMQAMARREISRAEGMKLLKEFKAAPQPKPTGDCDVPEKYKVCANDKDYLSQECWSDNYAPSLKIKFLDPNDYSKKPFVLCMQGKDFYEMYQNAETFSEWVPKFPGAEIEPEGYGGHPNTKKKYVKIFNYFIANPKSNFKANVRGEFNAYPLTIKRLGNNEGHFGVGQLHGQEPGHWIYYLVPSNTNDKKTKHQLLRKLAGIISPYASKQKTSLLYRKFGKLPTDKMIVNAIKYIEKNPICDNAVSSKPGLRFILDDKVYCFDNYNSFREAAIEDNGLYYKYNGINIIKEYLEDGEYKLIPVGIFNGNDIIHYPYSKSTDKLLSSEINVSTSVLLRTLMFTIRYFLVLMNDLEEKDEINPDSFTHINLEFPDDRYGINIFYPYMIGEESDKKYRIEFYKDSTILNELFTDNPIEIFYDYDLENIRTVAFYLNDGTYSEYLTLNSSLLS